MVYVYHRTVLVFTDSQLKVPNDPGTERAIIAAQPRNFDGVSNFGPRISDYDSAGINQVGIELEKTYTPTSRGPYSDQNNPRVD